MPTLSLQNVKGLRFLCVWWADHCPYASSLIEKSFEDVVAFNDTMADRMDCQGQRCDSERIWSKNIDLNKIASLNDESVYAKNIGPVRRLIDVTDPHNVVSKKACLKIRC
jgi:hypothetical protein